MGDYKRSVKNMTQFKDQFMHLTCIERQFTFVPLFQELYVVTTKSYK